MVPTKRIPTTTVVIRLNRIGHGSVNPGFAPTPNTPLIGGSLLLNYRTPIKQRHFSLPFTDYRCPRAPYGNLTPAQLPVPCCTQIPYQVTVTPTCEFLTTHPSRFGRWHPYHCIRFSESQSGRRTIHQALSRSSEDTRTTHSDERRTSEQEPRSHRRSCAPGQRR
jgi:hypothetical protein